MPTPAPVIGKCAWVDIAVPDAGPLRDFYASVIGWTPANHPMGDYDDYSMKNSDGGDAAGVCHARGMNAGLPPVWIPYFTVANLDEAKAKAIAGGGTIIDYPSTKVVYVRDPAGAVVALVEAT